jgi:hypothetical protein
MEQVVVMHPLLWEGTSVKATARPIYISQHLLLLERKLDETLSHEGGLAGIFIYAERDAGGPVNRAILAS